MYLRISILTLSLFMVTSASAGVFSIPHFVEPGFFSVGIEPEITLEQDDAGVAMNFKYTHGLSDLMNVGGTIGTGGGGRQFRIGGFSVFDFFPDYGSQPGIGIAGQAYYYRLTSGGTFEASVVPYIHKAFSTGGAGEIDPFVAFPIGIGTRDGELANLIHVSIGSKIKTSEKLNVIVELGVAINNTVSYFSGGAVYYY